MNRKKFAREAHWEEWKEKYYNLMEKFHINYKTYAEEYEDFVTEKIKQKEKEKTRNSSSSSSQATQSNRKDLYTILGVERNATEEEIKRNFRIRIMQVHPDYYQ